MGTEDIQHRNAPGSPGIKPTWTSSAKSGIGKSINSTSDVSFTLGHGTVNEVFFPREDIACTRDIKCIVTDGHEFFSDEEYDTDHYIEWMEEGVPAFRMVNTCKQKRYVIEKEVITDPIRNTLLQKIKFKPGPEYAQNDLHLYMLLSPAIRNKGMENTGWKGDFKGTPMLFARRKDITLAMTSSKNFLKRSTGFAGESDGFTDLQNHKKMLWEYAKAENGNIVLAAELNNPATDETIIAVGFGGDTSEAANNARASILDGFDLARAKYIFEWQRWQRSLANVKSDRNRVGRDFRKSAAILRVHESLMFPGGVIASLSIPWGETKGDGDLGGYHLVWPRDLALTSGGFLELNAKDDVLRILNYIMTTQEADGRWSQNMWIDGSPFWKGIQMDETALSVLLVHIAHEKDFVDDARCERYWPMVKKALIYLVTNGPYTKQDRWEEESGYTPFTLATEIAALVAGAALARANGETSIATYCLETADLWNESIEKWLYVTGTPLSERFEVDGYYMRINPFDRSADEVKNETIRLKNHGEKDGVMSIGEMVSVDALALVRFGLRDAHDPRILNTIKVIDGLLKTETPTGPCWHRYNDDGYGEDKNGDPYAGQGIGRAWPLLTGERAHYEIAAGNIETAKKLLKAMESFTNNSLLPEQIWDEADIPEKKLFFGRPTGSAMPLTWAHAEYIKLSSSLKHKRIVDMPKSTHDRFLKQKRSSYHTTWRFDHQAASLPPGKVLRIEVLQDAIIHWTDDNWNTTYETHTADSGLGIFVADIGPKQKNSDTLQFTCYWKVADCWENKDFVVTCTADAQG